MPNWCSTSYYFQFESEKKAQEFFDLVNSWLNEVVKSDFGESWLGNVVLNSKISQLKTSSDKSFDIEPYYSCRGWVVDSDLCGCEVSIYTETAWCPMHEMWEAIRQKYASDATVTYYAEEPGVLLYNTNDPEYEDTYNIDIYEDSTGVLSGLQSLHDGNKEDVFDIASRLNIATENRSIEDILDDINHCDTEDGTSVIVSAWTYIDCFGVAERAS